jgi:hypothetical protein
MKKFMTITAIVLSIVAQSFAQTVKSSEAEIIAKHFFYERANQFQKVDLNEIKTKAIHLIGEDQTDLYIVELDGLGFVGVSTSQSTIPVLFYSLEDNFDINNYPPAFNMWLARYKEQIQYTKANNLEATDEIQQRWARLSDKNQLAICHERALEPMVVTTWAQGNYYNDMCPEDENGAGGNAVTGCVATALAQLMYYHKFPETGIGSYSYEHPVYGTISVNYDEATYGWNNMLNELHEPNFEVAQLMHHAGVAVDMEYGPTSSGMWNYSADKALRTYFKYSPETHYIFRDSTDLNWDSILLTNLDDRKPMYYAGWHPTDPESGHAMVMDGYQTEEYFHLNMGWGGTADGYYYLDNLNPSGYNFNYHQEVIKDIYPDTSNYSYPTGCSVDQVVSGNSGTLNDGSSLYNYEDNLSCSWIIQPDCGQYVNIVFDRFDLGEGDNVIIYNGADVGSGVAATFNYANPPELSNSNEPTWTRVDAGAVLIQFITDGSDVANGWDISYYSGYCDEYKEITAISGTVNDGSDDCDYNNSEYCKWVLEPEGMNSITLEFTEFDMEESMSDRILIHHDSIGAATLVGNFNYTNIPTSLTIPSGKIIIQFSTGPSNTAGGWSFNYTSSFVGIGSNLNQASVNIYPNPVKDVLNVEIDSDYNEPVQIKLTNGIGQTIMTKNTYLETGSNAIVLNNGGDITNGIYIVSITSPSISMSKKVVIRK